ncbi:hypothetical protein [Rhizobium leguminosarum]|uniref:hypothetical protein n=1 Tax=Rhizobium leguminosarum TaxID=384 RepID=UPI0014411C37|nr:hypothetical protein [Rhizobium leguminosarum]MBY5869318.1 hypothetical protein [Rhizobium leguminosarum]NKM08384.1 hypothetical protein [Rhizobium leguminosarum bv. viciae]
MNRWRGTLSLLAWSYTATCSAETLVGKWNGSVDCIGQKDIKLRLSIKDENGRLAGEVDFSRGFLRSGYTIEGTGVVDNKFVLKPGKWTNTSLNVVPSEIHGEFFSMGAKVGIHGTLRVCKRGIFTAFREREREQATAEPPRAKPQERDVHALTKAVREGVSILAARHDRNIHWWRSIEHSVIFSRVDRTAKDALLSEVREAKANVFADWLLERELAPGPMAFPAGVGRAIYVFDEARRTDWPDNVKLRVYKECQKRVTDVLRPELEQIAALTETLPVSLDGLIRARTALNHVDAYKASLEDAFGTLDQENILPPARLRIAALEGTPLISDQLQIRLDNILKEPNPRSTTERLLLDISGFEPLSEPLGTIMREGWRRAAFAEIAIEDGGSDSNSFEPSASEIARHVFDIFEQENARLARKHCGPGFVDDPWTWSQCAVGETRIRLNKLSKIKCVEIEPKKTFTCHFSREAVWFRFQTGEVLENVSGTTSARFVKDSIGGWEGSALGMQ